MLVIKEGPLNALDLMWQFEKHCKEQNFGALHYFAGIVRNDLNIKGFLGLSFDIYMPILEDWFNSWRKKASEQNIELFMAHSTGNVLISEVSFICASSSSHRTFILQDFIEDFKKQAPIWKYDLVRDGDKIHKIYALKRSSKLQFSGLLGDRN
ncbi:MAG: molybdenum cofactor biosynthesis protein MoaE [Helicobacter sp.]|nr:molybdenum cofactor biosynthesis protein MoaE [Helicobacter sp.]